ncbi:TVG0736303 [Thermoplasma volcanium GSS1]|uniref:TVG0736303 protein n=1 Tax=Thermoplasma volcanium (strain ATCC 51530 / DSM 4299 / JCM 9571 / NBRC 15438 / GSS1) TaxID=273116 RepID=Q97AT0_THEVO|nr:TVG0736303 [Thermoplasma volcanium GSS1]
MFDGELHVGIRRKKSDIINIKKMITVIVKKRHNFVNKVPIYDDLLLNASLFTSKYNINGKLFNISRQRA